ncbi:NTP transferase domain-containing protein [Streptomyces sp. NPDC058045]|uniref:NTP transferase domain-containing protein n=1 Tax=Streptomyces sp. NPDC058045 TaxID=3346311 RepID=UPI0036E002D5
MNVYESDRAPARAAWPEFDAVVLAGGAARRLGGADKPGLRVGGRSLLDGVLSACAEATATVVVAEPRPTARPVRWAREDPPGGGPLAALDAGLARTTAPLVAVLSADLPFLRRATVHRLLETLTGPTSEALFTGAPPERIDGVLLVDGEGRWQPLVACYRSEVLRRELALLAEENGGTAGLPLRALTRRLELAAVPDPLASFDCDTWNDIATARSRIREHEHVLEEWITAVKDELGIDLDVDTRALLDLARDAAHGVARPAAPLTTFLVGYAAAQHGGGPEAVAEAARKAASLAVRRGEEQAAAEAQDAGPATESTPDSATGSDDG